MNDKPQSNMVQPFPQQINLKNLVYMIALLNGPKGTSELKKILYETDEIIAMCERSTNIAAFMRKMEEMGYVTIEGKNDATTPLQERKELLFSLTDAGEIYAGFLLRLAYKITVKNTNYKGSFVIEENVDKFEAIKMLVSFADKVEKMTGLNIQISVSHNEK